MDTQAILHFRDVHLKFVRLITRTLSRMELTLPKYALMSQLELLGTISMTEASERLMISKPALTKLVRRLEKDRLIKRKNHPEDHRSFLLELLPRGAQKVRRVQDFMLSFGTQAINEFPSSQREIIFDFMTLFSGKIDMALALAKREVEV